MRILVVVAAGSGARLGATVPKAFVEVGGTSLLAHTVARLADAVDRVVVVAPPDRLAVTKAVIGHLADARVVSGGATRSASVRAGLDAAGASGDDLVAIHDAARALAPASLLDDALTAVADGALAAAPALPVVDTLKQVDEGGVVTTVPRDDLVAVQTPQVALASTWRIAHEVHDEASDDLGLVERARTEGRLAGDVTIVTGSTLAMKVTHPVDLVVATALLAEADTVVGLEAAT